MCAFYSRAGLRLPAVRRNVSKPFPSTFHDYEHQACRRHKIPVFAIGDIENGKVRDISTAGVREKSYSTHVMNSDRFQTGSCTTSFTATPAALMVENGHLSWTTTVEEACPQLAERIDAACFNITLEQLLLHRSGLLPLTDPAEDRTLWCALTARKVTANEQRLALVLHVFSRHPRCLPAARRECSDVGCAVAHAMPEHRMGKPREELICKYIGCPPRLATLGFGPPATKSRESNAQQPCGHLSIIGCTMAVEPGADSDKPTALGPAGLLHLSIEELARYAAFSPDMRAAVSYQPKRNGRRGSRRSRYECARLATIMTSVDESYLVADTTCIR